MAVYAIGDVHGTLPELQRLLDAIRFDAKKDRLWFVGDLINRGPSSLEVLRYVKNLGEVAVCVMGNHEIRAAAFLLGDPNPQFALKMGYFENAPDRQEIAQWLCRLPFFHREKKLGWAMVHAGIAPDWSLDEAEARSHDLGRILSDPGQGVELLRGLWRTLPESSPPQGQTRDRYLYDLTVFTRIRLCTAQGRLLWPRVARALGLQSPYGIPPPEFPFQPWHQVRTWKPGERLLYGHWAAAGLQPNPPAIGLDSGCVYGGQLTALRLDHSEPRFTQVSCAQYISPKSN